MPSPDKLSNNLVLGSPYTAARFVTLATSFDVDGSHHGSWLVGFNHLYALPNHSRAELM